MFDRIRIALTTPIDPTHPYAGREKSVARAAS